ncbi:MAG: amidohydrolase family protein [Fibrobacterota bacterium]
MTENRLELRNGRFFDVREGCFHPAGVRLILNEGRIEALPGLPGEPEAFGGAAIDLHGKYVLPGLINTHCHTALTSPTLMPDLFSFINSRRLAGTQRALNMEECVLRGITTLRDAWAGDLRPVQNLRGRIASGAIQGPRILQSIVLSPTGGYLAPAAGFKGNVVRTFAGLPFVDYNSAHSGVIVVRPDAGEAELRDAVDRAVDGRDADFIKVAEQSEDIVHFKPGASYFSQAQLAVIADRARARGKRTTLHQVTRAGFRRGLAAGIDSLVHLPRDARLEEADLRALAASAALVEPTLSMAFCTAWKVPGDPNAELEDMAKITRFREEHLEALARDFWLPELVPAVLRTLQAFCSEDFRAFGLVDLSYRYRYYSRVVNFGTENFRLLYHAGARFAMGNDGGVPPCTPAMLGLEFPLMVLFLKDICDRMAFNIPDFIRMATLQGAEALGLEATLGSIEKGKRADLVVYGDNPLETPELIGNRADAVFLDGKLIVNRCGLGVEG